LSLYIVHRILLRLHRKSLKTNQGLYRAGNGIIINADFNSSGSIIMEYSPMPLRRGWEDVVHIFFIWGDV